MNKPQINKPRRILLVEDSDDDALLLVRMLRQNGYDPLFERVDTRDAMVAALDREEWDIILSDYSMPQFSAEAALKIAQERNLDIPFIIVSGAVGEDALMEVLKAGAQDFVTKGKLGRLVPAIERASSEADTQRARKQAEEALRKQAADLARSNAELEQFAYICSHDLQEPLRMVTSYLELTKLKYEDRLDEEGKEYIAYAVEGATRMQSLIKDLLVYSRASRCAAPMVPTACDVILADALADLQVAITESDARITRDPLPIVVADAVQLTMLFENLIGNAIKFHGEEPPRVHISAERANGQWTFSIQDNGIGILPKYAERIFVIFQRLHSRGKYPGTGIGLAVCKRIVEWHGGQIWLDLLSNKGARFYFTLPGEEAELSHRQENI